MNRQDYFRMLTKGIKLAGEDNKSVLERFGYLKRKKEENEDDSLLQSEEGEREASRKRKKKRSLQDKEKLANIKQQEINHVRNVHKIHVHGGDVPPPVQTFHELSSQCQVKKEIVENLRLEGFETPTPVQMQTWPLLMRRREVLVSAPTGSGKTAAFLVPVVHHLKGHMRRGFRAVILAPTRELARQIVRESERLSRGTGVRSSVIDKVKAEHFLSFLKKIDILITTPNRLVHLIKSDVVNQMLLKVEWLVVDESDRLYESGSHGFRDQLAVIYKACSGASVVRAMFSATYDYHVEQWCRLSLNDPVIISIGIRNSSCSDVDQELVFCGSDRGKLIALREVIRQGYEPPVLIFVQTKDRARQLHKELVLDDLRVGCIHSDNTKAQRDHVVQCFRERKIWLLICTELMGRGIDFVGVNMVINYDFPPSVVSYIHRVGRTGRAGRKGIAKTFWTLEDKPLLRSIAQVMKDSGSEVEDFLLNLKKEEKKTRREFAKNLPERGFISEGAKREKLLEHRRKAAKVPRLAKLSKGQRSIQKKEENGKKYKAK